MLNGQPWELRSRWMLRVPGQRSAAAGDLICLIEHEVTVSSPSSSLELVARFVHALARLRARGRAALGQGGLVSLVVRNRRQCHRARSQRRANPKQRGAPIAPLFRYSEPFEPVKLRSSPQSRASGSCSPVGSPLALPSSLAIMPSAPLTPLDEAIKEDVAINNTVAVPSPASAALPDQNPSANIDQQQQPQQQPQQLLQESELPIGASAAQTRLWLRARRFDAFEANFVNFSAFDMLQLSRNELIQICGLADGIRLFNNLHGRELQPRLSLYFALEAAGPSRVWRAVYLDSLTLGALTDKLLGALGLAREQLNSILVLKLQRFHVLVNDDVVAHIKDESSFLVEIIDEPGIGRYKLLLKPSSS